MIRLHRLLVENTPPNHARIVDQGRIGSAGTSAGDAENRFMETGGAKPKQGAMNARANISPNPSMIPLINGKPMLIANTAEIRKARRCHATPGASMDAIVSSPVGAGGKGASSEIGREILSSTDDLDHVSSSSPSSSSSETGAVIVSDSHPSSILSFC